MSREDELFDDFLRSSFGSKKFTNKPHYWQNAQEMIAQGRKNNNSFRPIIAGSAVLVAALGFLLMFRSTSSVRQPDSNALTASAVSVGTTTTSSYNLNIIPVNNTDKNGQPATEAQALNNADVQTLEPGTAPSASYLPATNDNPKRTKKNRNRQNRTTEQAPSPEQHQPLQVIDINGRTLTKPFNTTMPSVGFNKTNVYLTYAANAQKSFIAVEAGINMYNPGNNLLNGINGHAGIRYYRFLSSRLALSTGLTYARIEQNLPGRSFDYTGYDFGKNTSAVVITTQRLDYIELPVSVLYQLTPKHSLTAGMSLGYVIGSTDMVQDETGKQTSQNGYLDGINRWDAQLNLGYQFNLSQRMWIRSSYHMGFTDISDNTLFKHTATDTNKGIRITLGYKVF